MTLDQVDVIAGRALSDLSHVSSLANAFRAGLHASSMRTPPKGTRLVVAEGVPTGELFGAPIDSSCRTVVVGGRFRALEWSFFAEVGHERVRLLTVYQWEDGNLTSTSVYDPGEEDNDVICDVGNTHVAKILIGLMIPVLLASEIFAPAA